MVAVPQLCTLAIGFVIFCSSWRQGEAAVISIDLGSEWIKVALVKPGVPMEIVLNKESKRKTPAVVSLRNDDRLIGGPALNTAVKYPKSAYRYLQLLVGQKFDSAMVNKYREWFPFYDLRKDEERGTVLFQHDKETVYSPEELIAMLLNNSRHIAEDYAGVPVRDAVITIPTFFNQAQRRVILHAAALVGLNVLQLMSNSAAAALNYGLFRQASFNTTAFYVMFYDMGAASTTATIVEYRKVQVKEGTLANVHPQLTVKGSGFSRLLGGMEIDVRLQQHLARQFEAQRKTSNSVFESPRAMAKLLKEAQRIKQVLSANSDHYAQVEGLLDEIDFRLKVTRAELEEMCADMFDRIGDPVKQALEAADMTMDEIDSVILVGAGTRVPKVQENLLKAVNKSDLGKSLNTDEAIVLGAVYQGAGYTKLFRIKKFIVKEGAAYPIQVSFDRISQVISTTDSGEEMEEEVVKTVKRTLFQRSNPYPTKKVLTFNRHTSDFAFQVLYGDLQFMSENERSYFGRLNISEYYLAGVGDALKQHPRGEAKGIKAHFVMDESGFLTITNVESVFEYPENVEEESTLSKIGSTISSFFGMGGDDGDSKQDDRTDEEEVPADANDTETVSGTRTKREREHEAEPVPDINTEDSDSEADEIGEQAAKEDQDDVDSGIESTDEVDQDDVDSGIDSTDEADQDNVDSGIESTDEATQSDGTDGGKEGADEMPDEEDVKEEEEKEVAAEEDKEEEQLSEGEKEKGEGDATSAEEEEAEKTEESDEENKEDGSDDGEKVVESADAVNASLPMSPLNGSANATNMTSKAKSVPKEHLVKVNLTLETTILDLALPTKMATEASIEKLVVLYQRDEEKKANEQAKNALESHVFETKDAMYSELVMEVSTEEQREVILTALNEAGDWLEDEGYLSDTKTYKGKLRELKRVSRPLFKRLKEKELRPKVLSRLVSSINMSMDFLARVKNLSTEVTVITEVEITTLESLIQEIQDWAVKKVREQEALPAHEDPVLLAHEVEEHNKRLDREVMYLVNKIRSHPPPSFKTPTNKTNATDTNNTKSGSTASKDPLGDTTLSDDRPTKETTPSDEQEGKELPTTPSEEQQEGTESLEEPLELPGPGDSSDSGAEQTSGEPVSVSDTDTTGENPETSKPGTTSTSDDSENHKEL